MTNPPEAVPHRLLGLYDSPFVRRVAVTMHLYEVSFEHVSLSVFRHMDAMRPINPLFKVPMLTLPGGETLYESAYILDYLDEQAVERGIAPLIPHQGPERRQMQQLMALAIVATEKAVAIEYERKRPRELQWADWTERLRGQMRQAFAMLDSGQPEVWDALTREFESALIRVALGVTRGRRIEAAQRLGIGRNTITRKIQELGLE